MIKSVRVRNFQSHPDTAVDFAPGINAFIGESDQGLMGTGFSQADLQTLQDALEKFDPELESEPEPEPNYNNQDDWVLEPLEGPDGTCSSVLVHRFDRRSLSLEDFQNLRVALGLGRAPRGALSTYGIGAWG